STRPLPPGSGLVFPDKLPFFAPHHRPLDSDQTLNRYWKNPQRFASERLRVVARYRYNVQQVSSGDTHEQYIAQIEWVDIGLPGIGRNWLCVPMLAAVTRL